MGRLDYFDPSTLAGEGNSIQPYEDYCIAIDLTVEIPDRYSCGLSKENGRGRRLEFSTNDNTISFLSGAKLDNNDDKSYLTTNFTDISMTNPGANTKECFGIESISISFEKKLFPIVKIKFVDVRGATLMQPSEAGYYNKNDLGNSEDLYRAFFTMPYPTFILKVKGFYGNGSTYRLHLQSANIEFNNQTGNFNISASFTGDRYGIYSDLPLSYLALAPFTQEGHEYWTRCIKDGVFKFRDEYGNITKDMMTLPELKYRIAVSLNNQESKAVINEGKTFDESYDESIRFLDALYREYPFSKKKGWRGPDNFKIDLKDVFSGEFYPDGKFYYKFVQDINTVFLELIQIHDYFEKLKEYDKNRENDNGIQFSNIFSLADMRQIERGLKMDDERAKDAIERFEERFIKEDSFTLESGNLHEISDEEKLKLAQIRYIKNMVFPIEYNTDSKNYSGFTYGLKYHNTEGFLFVTLSEEIDYTILKPNHDIVKQLNDLVPKPVFNPNEWNPKDGNYQSFLICVRVLETNIHDLYESEKKRLEDERNSIKDEYRNKELERQEQILGFKPSVKNMYNLIFAHMETFMHCFYKYNEAIDKQITYHELDRNKKYQGLNNDMTDTPNSTYGNSFYDFLPPYTTYYQKDYDGKKVMVWPDRVATHADKLVELDFVEEIIDGSVNLNEEFIRTSSEIVDGALVYDNVSNSSVYDFIPITPYEIVHKDRCENPYEWLVRKGDMDPELFCKLIIYTFALRLMSTGGKVDSDYASYKSFGTIEGINFVKAFGNSFTDCFLYFVKNLPNIAAKIRYYLTENNTEFGVPLLTKTTFNFKKSATGLYYSNIEALPIGEYNYNKILEEIQTGSYSKSSKYLKSKDITDERRAFSDDIRQYIGYLKAEELGNNIDSFYIIDSSNYLEKIMDVFYNNELRGEGAHDNQTVSKRDKTGYVVEMGYDDIKAGYSILLDAGNIQNTSYALSSVTYIPSGHEVREVDIPNIYDEPLTSQLENYFIRYPSRKEDEFCLLEMELFNNNGVNHRFQAYLFLQSLPITNLGKEGNILESSKNGRVLKSLLLREGSYYWYEDNIDNLTGVKWGNVIKNEANEILATDEKNDHTKFMYTKYKGIENKYSYSNWAPPHGTSSSRRKKLKEYFIKWADDTTELGFRRNVMHLTNADLFVDKEKCYGLKRFEGKDLSTQLGRNAVELQNFLIDLFFSVKTIFDMYNNHYFYNPNDEGNYPGATNGSRSGTCLTIHAEGLGEAFYYFFDTIRLSYESNIEAINDNIILKYNHVTKNFYSTDIRLSTYMTFKSLYEKWLCLPSDTGYKDRWSLGDIYKDTSDFEQFIYMDTFYNDIGYKFTVNLNKINNMISSSIPTLKNTDNNSNTVRTNISVFEYLDKIAQDNGAMLFAAPNGAFADRKMEERFKPMPVNSNWDNNNKSFLFLYSYKPAEHLGSTDTATLDMNGWPGEGDGLDLEDNKTVNELFGSNSSLQYTVPAFCVTYAKQNQSFFKNISLNTSNAGVTDASIGQTLNIASKEGNGPRETLFYGQDIYRIMANKSYKCSVEAMGNTQILPMMYFQLNNIPFWKGAYLITNVTHDIQPGNITTKFEGYKQNKTAIPLVNATVFSTNREDIHKEGFNAEKFNTEPNIDNNTEKRNIEIRNIVGNANVKLIDGIDVVSADTTITKENPLICITPAHGPLTSKSKEWSWSYDISNRLKEKLVGKGYNVHFCNKLGKNTTRKGYSMKEARQMIKRFGSDKVISVAPHWNAGGGKRYEIFVHWSGYERPDSMDFARCMQSAVKDMLSGDNKARFDKYQKAIGTEKQVYIYPLDKYFAKSDDQDGAPRLDCPCILTENWFADCNYETGKSGLNEFDLFNKGLKPECSPDLFYHGLMSDEIKDIIVDIHVNGIENYIKLRNGLTNG